MDAEESGSDSDPVLKILSPKFMEIFRTIREDMDIIFANNNYRDFSDEERMIAAVGALMSMKMEESVKVLKTPVKMMKVGPGGIIQPG